MRRLLHLILATLACCALPACGYKGPLVRAAATPAATPAVSSTAPASASSS